MQPTPLADHARRALVRALHRLRRAISRAASALETDAEVEARLRRMVGEG